MKEATRSRDCVEGLGLALGDRRGELEQATLARITEIADPFKVADPGYVAGLRSAVAAALEYGFAAIAEPQQVPPPVPIELLTQARHAARNGVSLDVVLRRCSAGHGVIADAVLEEAEALELSAPELKRALRALAATYDRIVAAVSVDYEREASAEPQSPEHRRCALLRRLIAGEPLDTSSLDYPFDGHHVALVASGEAAASALLHVAERFDRRLLLAEPEAPLAWAWIGGRLPFACEELALLASHSWPRGCAVACGEPGQGLAGWRLSHHQAAVALPVAELGSEPFVHYNDVALLVAALRDEMLASSLRRTYLLPLEDERDRGSSTKETLSAYLGASCNTSSAAAALGVSRRTVAKRLLVAEELLGRPLNAAAAELAVALRLDRFERTTQPL